MQIAPVTAEEMRPLLRPDQIVEMKKDIQNAEDKLKNPGIEDKDEVRRQLIRLKKSFTEQVPQPFANGEDEGKAVARAKELLQHVLDDGMLSQAEMRLCPPRAPDEHLKWERRNKAAIMAWKAYQIRLNPGDREAANLEYHRPSGSGRMNLDTTFVERKAIFGVDKVTTVAVVFSDAELIYLQAISPDDHARVASMSNEERAVWKKTIALLMDKAVSKATPEKPKRAEKRGMTAEQKASLKAGREAYWAKKKTA